MGVEYTGAGGVRKFYGPRPSPALFPDPGPAKESTYGCVTEVLIRFDQSNVPNPSAASANDAVEHIIPANSYIIAARLYVENAFAGGTSIALETRTPSTGAQATANAFITATQGAVANLTQGAWILGSGSLIGASVGTSDVKVGLAVVGTFTAGRAGVVLTYLTPTA